jgi:hypothetical protein
LTTPNKTIYPANIIWNTDLPPVHLWWFSENSMRYIANKLNASVQFVDFTEYYRKKHVYCNIKIQQNIKDRKHVFSWDGKIIERTNKQKNKLMSFFAEIPFAKYLYNKLNPDTLLYGKTGKILTAILKIDATNE